MLPENRALIRTNNRRKYNAEQKRVQTKCMNPFHYLQRHLNLSRQRPTKCPCSNEIYAEKTYSRNDVRSFIQKFPPLLNPKRPILRNPTESSKKYIQLQLWSKHDDIIRSTHDRGRIYMTTNSRSNLE